MTDPSSRIETQSSPTVPPLRIHHFLIWTAVTAAIISGYMTFDGLARNGPPIESRIVIAGLVLAAEAFAGAVTVFGAGFDWRRRGLTFPCSLGDWLLVIFVATVVLGVALFALFMSIFFVMGDDDWFPAYVILAGIIQVAAWLGMHVVAIRQADTYAWRTVFTLLMLIPFLLGPRQIVDKFGAAFIACVLWASCVDWIKSIERPWTHWSGVAYIVAIGISLIYITISK